MQKFDDEFVSFIGRDGRYDKFGFLDTKLDEEFGIVGVTVGIGEAFGLKAVYHFGVVVDDEEVFAKFFYSLTKSGPALS